MAHCSCFFGHSMWDGDGTPSVWVYPAICIRRYQVNHPYFKLDDYYYDLEYCLWAEREPELDCWYCDECGSLVVFVGDQDRGTCYIPSPLDSGIDGAAVANWNLYIAMRDQPHEEFCSFSVGMKPYDALISFQDSFRCLVSPDRSTILVFNFAGELLHHFCRAERNKDNS